MKKILIVLVSVALLFCFIEVFFRAFYPHSTYSVTYASYGWKHIANTKTVFYGEVPKFGWGQRGIEVKYNWNGLRDKNTHEYEEWGRIILCVGDSWLEDMGSEFDNLITTYMDNELLPIYHIINAGHYGFNNTQELMWYIVEGYKYSPDIVLLFYAGDMASGEYIEGEYIEGKDGMWNLKFKTFTLPQKLYRNTVSFIRLHSHFGNWVLNRLNRVPRVKNYLVKKGYKETDKPIVGASATFKDEQFRLIDGSIFLELDRQVKRQGGVLVMINCLGEWSDSQKNVFENCNIRYVTLDFDVINECRRQKDIDIKEGNYKPELESHRFGYKANEKVSQMIIEFLKKEKLI